MITAKGLLAAAAASCMALAAVAQGEVEDYRRAFDAPRRFSWDKVTGTASGVTWTEQGDKFYYRSHTPEGDIYRVVDVASKSRADYKTIGEVRAALGLPEPEERRPSGPHAPAKHWMVTDPETAVPTVRRRLS